MARSPEFVSPDTTMAKLRMQSTLTLRSLPVRHLITLC